MPKFFLLIFLKKRERDTHTHRHSEVTIFRTYNFLPTAPEYRAPFSVDSNLSVVCVNWSGSFLLNGPLKEFMLTDGGQRVYSGFDTTLYIPRTADKSQCLTPTSQCVRSPVLQLYRTSNLKVTLLIINMSWFKWPLLVGKLLLRGKKIFFPSAV